MERFELDEVDKIVIEEVMDKDVKYVDVMKGALRWDVKVHDHGLVSMVDVMPRLVPEGSTCDFAIVQAARVSYGAGTKKVSEDRGLIRYLARHRHTTPFEMIEFKFHCIMPMFVARQWIRHRTANVNEYSARYSVLPDKYYKPGLGDIKVQSTENKQGRGEEKTKEMTAQEFLDYLDELEKNHKTKYEAFLAQGMSREQARMALPVNVYTEWYWKIDLHNLFHFLGLRMDLHAQKEIRDYANAMFAMVRKLAPYACEAFKEYRMEGLHFTKLELDAMRNRTLKLDTENKRETEEWIEKLQAFSMEYYNEFKDNDGERARQAKE